PGDDPRLAIALFSDRSAVSSWLSKHTRELFSVPYPVKAMTWSDIPARAYAPSLTKRVAKLVAKLQVGYPGLASPSLMFRRVCQGVAHGEGPAMAWHFEPLLAQLPTRRAELATNIVANVLSSLFVGALLERGAVLETSLGEPGLVFQLEGERVEPEVLVEAAMKDDSGAHTLQGWSERLCMLYRPVVAPEP
ncbi:MAG: hypothetical protein K0S65_3315, partial [Labilithrix sp.]|nr:hypothetical protein [Labilithrix sp.]